MQSFSRCNSVLQRTVWMELTVFVGQKLIVQCLLESRRKPWFFKATQNLCASTTYQDVAKPQRQRKAIRSCASTVCCHSQTGQGNAVARDMFQALEFLRRGHESVCSPLVSNWSLALGCRHVAFRSGSCAGFRCLCRSEMFQVAFRKHKTNFERHELFQAA